MKQTFRLTGWGSDAPAEILEIREFQADLGRNQKLFAARWRDMLSNQRVTSVTLTVVPSPAAPVPQVEAPQTV